jgi:hypothetical protein
LLKNVDNTLDRQVSWGPNPRRRFFHRRDCLTLAFAVPTLLLGGACGSPPTSQVASRPPGLLPAAWQPLNLLPLARAHWFVHVDVRRLRQHVATWVRIRELLRASPGMSETLATSDPTFAQTEQFVACGYEGETTKTTVICGYGFLAQAAAEREFIARNLNTVRRVRASEISVRTVSGERVVASNESSGNRAQARLTLLGDSLAVYEMRSERSVRSSEVVGGNEVGVDPRNTSASTQTSQLWFGDVAEAFARGKLVRALPLRRALRVERTEVRASDGGVAASTNQAFDANGCPVLPEAALTLWLRGPLVEYPGVFGRTRALSLSMALSETDPVRDVCNVQMNLLTAPLDAEQKRETESQLRGLLNSVQTQGPGKLAGWHESMREVRVEVGDEQTVVAATMPWSSLLSGIEAITTRSIRELLGIDS